MARSLAQQHKYDSSYYSQWERRRQGGGSLLPPTPVAPTKNSTRVCQSHSAALSNPPTRTARYGVKSALGDPTEERCKLLQMKVSSCRTTLGSLQKREQELIVQNLDLKDKIMQAEKPEHDAVKKLLRKYEKFRAGMSYLCDNFQSAVERETTAMNELKALLDEELRTVQSEVDSLDLKLKSEQNEVYVLNNYKDKEYPVKAIKIAELLAELDRVEVSNEDEVNDLEGIIDTELQKLVSKGQKTETELKDSALSAVLRKMHPSIKEMAEQNRVMEKEIAYHKKEIVRIEDDIERLTHEVKQLLLHPKTNVRMQVFPEFFKYEQKCTPDMEIVLDIPTMKQLPI